MRHNTKYSTSPTPGFTNFPRSTSPLPAPANYQATTASAAVKRYKYLRRLFKYDQMDFEFATWQMIYLFISPQKVFRNFNYRKHTKSQFARDDPAFLVILSIWLVFTTICYGLVLGLGANQILMFVFFVLFVDFIGFAMLCSTIMWYISNKYFRRDPDGPDVEWGYSFDIHINAIFPPFALLHCFQFILYDVGILRHVGLFSLVISNAFWAAALFYYVYITFLGYSNLPILQHTRALLLPLPIIFISYFITLILGWNISETLMYFYKYRL